MTRFKPGDVVRRTDVDPAVAANMTVREIRPTDRLVVCDWFVGANAQQGTFSMTDLETMERQSENVIADGKGHSFKRAFWGGWVDKPILIHCKNNVLIKGVFVDYETNFLHLKDATISGRRTVRVQTVHVDRDAISHFHEDLAAVSSEPSVIFDKTFLEVPTGSIDQAE